MFSLLCNYEGEDISSELLRKSLVEPKKNDPGSPGIVLHHTEKSADTVF